MAYRTMVGGVEVSCDTPEELVTLVKAAANISVAARSSSPARVQLPTVRMVKPPRAESTTRFSRPNKLGVELLGLLKQYYPNEVTSEQLMAQMGKPSSSMPIIMSGLTAWARHSRTTIGALIDRKVKYIDGKQRSVYRITEEGLRAFQNSQGEQRLPM